MTKILVTGGTGFIGSHTAIELLKAGHNLVIVDNFSNSKPEVLNKIRYLANKPFVFYSVDLQDKDALNQVFAENQKIDAVLHFASLKAVSDSILQPLKYYYNNLMSTLTLLECMATHDVKRLVFSSSAAVYGLENVPPLKEDMPLSAANSYGRTKLMIEQIIEDLVFADSDWSVAILRYFNAVGAHESGQLGEDSSGIPTNLMPYISQVAAGNLNELEIYGKDYETSDGTGVRDYTHVMDLAIGHVKALDYIFNNNGIENFNLGTGKGYTVLEVIKIFERVSGQSISYKFTDRRVGDVAVNYADATKAKEVLNWSATRTIEKICEDAWRWQLQSSKGRQ